MPASTSYKTMMETPEYRPVGQERRKGQRTSSWTTTSDLTICCQIRSRPRCWREFIQGRGGLQSHKQPYILLKKTSIYFIISSSVILHHIWLLRLAPTALFQKQCVNCVNLSCNLPFPINQQQKWKRPLPLQTMTTPTKERAAHQYWRRQINCKSDTVCLLGLPTQA